MSVRSSVYDAMEFCKDRLKRFDYGTIAVFFVLVCVYGWIMSVGKKRRVLPPGPGPLPIVGNLFQLGAHPHQALAQLAEQYGNIMTVFFGSVRVVVVSDATMARELYSVSDASFASRPVHDLMYTAAQYMNYDGGEEVSMTFSKYSPRVREARQLCISELFTTQKLGMKKSVRMEEIRRMVAKFKETGAGDRPVEVRPVVSEFALRTSCRAIFNKAFLDSGERLPWSEGGLHPEVFRKWEEVAAKVLAESNITDIIPILRPVLGKLDLQGLHAQWRYVTALKLSLMTSVVEWYRKHASSASADIATAQESTLDFAETLMHLRKDSKYTEIVIKSILAELLQAGSDTTGGALEWALLELVRHPPVMERLQAEVDEKFGMYRPVDEDETAQLPYLQAVVKEALRLHPPTVLAVPHCNMEDATLGGYHIPAGTSVFANLWAIHRDPSAWGDDAQEFNPNRFLGTNLNVNGTNYQFLPFGAGRRICPGRSQAMRVLCAGVGSFVHAFEWSALPGVELNANDGCNSLNIRPKTPLVLRISLRPAATLYL